MKKGLFLLVLFLMALPSVASDDVLKGDVDGDGKVNISDVSALIDYVLTRDATTIDLLNADVDDDGEIGIADVADLIDLILQIEPEPQESIETITIGDVTFNMVLVEGGTFEMGATPEQEIDSRYYPHCYPVHEVTLSSYSIGQTEVTQALWVAVMGSNPSYFSDDLSCPVEQVTWYDCKSFIAKLNELTGKTFRLPTEAEWEFAARGGNKSMGYRFSGSNDLDAVAWTGDNAEGMTHPVGQKAPNELGLNDMTGNVIEFCQDWYGYDYYSISPSINPTGPTSGDRRIKRGGGFWDNSYNGAGFAVAMRNYSDQTYSFRHTGLRLAL
ncbi:MAG: SUMF1/EgtB/PvdO family nonheme iron enzyme [Muribaculaceae bacterium]|nr:SUMF1/EgtB/PvdO family nonheme iron enzyme [Muribaculaceae bacterium]